MYYISYVILLVILASPAAGNTCVSLGLTRPALGTSRRRRTRARRGRTVDDKNEEDENEEGGNKTKAEAKDQIIE